MEEGSKVIFYPEPLNDDLARELEPHGVNGQILKAFLTEVALQIRFALMADEDLRRAAEDFNRVHLDVVSTYQVYEEAERIRQALLADEELKRAAFGPEVIQGIQSATDALKQDHDAVLALKKLKNALKLGEDERQLLTMYSNDVHQTVEQNTRALKAAWRAADRIWYCLQALLIAAANISKLLNLGNANFKPDEREVLQRILGINKTSPLASRELRNHFEHLDERLLDWWRKNPYVLMDRVIGNTMIKALPGSPDHLSQSVHLRHFEPSTYTLSFHDQPYDLRPVIAELRKLAKRLEDVL